MSSYIWVSIRVHPGGFRKIQILGHLTWEKYRAVLRFHLFTTRWECRVFFWWCMNKTPQFIIFLVLSYLILHLCVRNILSIFFLWSFWFSFTFKMRKTCQSCVSSFSPPEVSSTVVAITLISRMYALIWWCFSSNWYSGQTDTADDLTSFISFLLIYHVLWNTSLYNVHACCCKLCRDYY